MSSQKATGKVISTCLIPIAILLGESILTIPDDLHFFYMLGDDLQSDLFHHLSRDDAEADWPVVSWLLLAALLEEGCNTGFHPVTRHLLFSIFQA